MNFTPSQGISLAGLANAGVETSVTQTLLRNMNIPLHNITSMNTVPTHEVKVQLSTHQAQLLNSSPNPTQSKALHSSIHFTANISFDCYRKFLAEYLHVC